MHPFLVFGLPLDADVPAIKRAYSQLLRKHRPDEDPQAFQRIHEAYQACLQLAARRVAAGPVLPTPQQGATIDHAITRPFGPTPVSKVDASTDPNLVVLPRQAAAVAAPAPLPSAAPQAIFSLKEFVDEVFRRDAEGPTAMHSWLQGHLALYSLALKQSVTAPLAFELMQRKEHLNPECLGVLLHFFNLDTVSPNNPRLDGLIVELRRKTQSAWQFNQQTTSWNAVGAGTRFRAGRAQRPEAVDRLLMNELLKPFNIFRRLLIVLVPSLPIRTMAMLVRLRQIDADSAKQRVNPGTAAFWEQACDQRHLRRPRLSVVVSRIFGVCAISLLIADTPLDVVPLILWSIGLWLSFALARIGWFRLDEWQKTHPRFHVRSWLVIACLGIGLVVGTFMESVFAICFFGVALWLLVINPPMQYRKAALIAIVCGTSTLMAVIEMTGYTPQAGIMMSLAFTASCLVVMAHDFLIAEIRGIPLAKARYESTWLAIVIIAWIVVVGFGGTIAGNH